MPTPNRGKNKLRTCSVLLFFCILLTHSQANSQPSEAFEFVRADWHLAGISEFHGDWQAAIGYYQKVIQESQSLPIDVREWYRGTAQYGIARCDCRLGKDSVTIRTALSKAFSHHFWNFALAGTDPQIMLDCGRRWLDSLSSLWSSISNEERPLWLPQAPIIFYPVGYDSTSRWPLILALHGGNDNYESFAENWLGMATDLHAIIVVPAGVIRESQITNSWGSDMGVIEKPIIDLVKTFTSRHLADPEQVYLAGFSQGAQASLELAVRRPDLFHGTIAMSGFVDSPITDSMLSQAHHHGLKIYAISGENENQTFRAELSSFDSSCTKAKIPFEMETISGMIHEIPLDFHTQILQAWQWLRPTTQATIQGEK